MILFLDEERAYLNWAAHHRAGFVLDCMRHPTKAHLTLHRATCPTIKRSPSKRTHWTTGKHMKACSLDVGQLKAWALDQAGHEPTECAECMHEPPPEITPHLTRLDRDILDYVLEIAAIHLDDADYPYRVTASMVARCLGKTEGQLMAALHRLIDDGLLVLDGATKPDDALPLRASVMPTVKAFRTLPAFAEMAADDLQDELRKLTNH